MKKFVCLLLTISFICLSIVSCAAKKDDPSGITTESQTSSSDVETTPEETTSGDQTSDGETTPVQTTPEGSTTPSQTTPSTTTKPTTTKPTTTKPTTTDPVTTNPPTVLDTFEFDLAMNKTLSDRFEMVVIDVSSSKLLKVQSTSVFKYSGADGANYYGHNIVETDTYCHGTPEQGAILDLNTRETYLAAIAFTAPVEGTYRFRADLTRLYWVGGDSNATSHYLLVYNDYNSRASSTKYNAKTTPTKTDSASVSHDYTIDLKAGQKLVMVIERVANTTGNHRTGINSITVDLTKSKNPYTTTTQGTVTPPANYNGPVLNVTVNKGTVSTHVSGRPYDPNKEDVTLILVIGQSNFTRFAGYVWDTPKIALPTIPKANTVYSVLAGEDTIANGTSVTFTDLNSTMDMNTISDPSKGITVGGVTPAFGARWNELSGTKVVFVQAAVQGTSICEWQKDESFGCDGHFFRSHLEKQGHSGPLPLYADAVKSFTTVYNALKENYNIVYSGYIWNQGEANENILLNCPITGDKQYYDAYKSMHDDLMNDLDLDFGGISVVRSHYTLSSPPAQRSNAYTCARAAQYKLVNDISNLYMLSTISETCDPTTDDMDSGNSVHYSQKTFNKMGKEMAENLYSVLGLSDTANVYGGIRVSAKSGKILLKTDEDGNAESGDYYLTQANTGGRIQIALNTLGNNNTVSYTLKNGSTDLSSYINAYGVIDWTGLSSKGVTEILIKVEYK